METNDILTNEEVITTTEQIEKSNSGNGFMIAAGVGLTMLVGGLLYKYAVIPTMTKIKNYKRNKTTNNDSICVDTESDEIIDEIKE